MAVSRAAREGFLEMLLGLGLEDSQAGGMGEGKGGGPRGHCRHSYSSIWFANLLVYLCFLVLTS